jgi:hypothetical protein
MAIQEVKITNWPGVFWICFWLFWVYLSLCSIKDELRGIRECMETTVQVGDYHD